MAPRKKAPTSKRNINAGSDEHSSQPAAHDAMPHIVAKIESVRAKRKAVRKEIKEDHLKAMTELRTRITKHHETEVSKRSQVMVKLLSRLSNAIEKKAACEKAMLNLVTSLRDPSSTITVLMSAVLDGRRDRAAKERSAFAAGSPSHA